MVSRHGAHTGLRVVRSRASQRRPGQRDVARNLSRVFREDVRRGANDGIEGGRMKSAEELSEMAKVHAARIVTTVDFNVTDRGLSFEQFDAVMTVIHNELVRAYMAGYLACSETDRGEAP